MKKPFQQRIERVLGYYEVTSETKYNSGDYGMTNNLMQIDGANQTMTSQQIAELVGSRHDSVKRAIERIADKGVITLPPLVEASFKDFIGKTQRTTVYIFSGEQGKRDSIIVVAQLSPEFTGALVDRWQELEAQLAKPSFQIPQTLSEALQLAADQTRQLELAAPKIAHYDNVVDRKGLLNATQIAQKIRMSAIAMNKALAELGVYNKSVKRSRVFQQWFIDQDLGVIKQTDQGYSQALFTTKGEAWIIERLISKGVA